jgi:uncharacterized membrane protein
MKNIQIIIQIASIILSAVAVAISALAMRWAYEIRRIERRRAERVTRLRNLSGQLSPDRLPRAWRQRSTGHLYRLPPDRLPPCG